MSKTKLTQTAHTPTAITPTAPTPPAQAQLLFAQRHNTRPSHPSVPGSTLRRGQQHAHPFWQLDVLQRSCVLHLGRQQRRCEAPCLVWIPPNVQHVFEYDDGRDFLSMKLALQTKQQAAIKILPLDAELHALLDPIDYLFGEECSPGPRVERIISHLLGALFEWCMDDVVQEQVTEDPALQSAYQQIVDRAGVGIQVAQLAEEIGQTPSYLSRKFKQAFGTGLKQFIQAQRAQRAKDLLRYADLSISEIADVLGFPDAFCFSKFFKHQFEQSPRHYRQSLLDH